MRRQARRRWRDRRWRGSRRARMTAGSTTTRLARRRPQRAWSNRLGNGRGRCRSAWFDSMPSGGSVP
jgi:hypothetical protein